MAATTGASGIVYTTSSSGVFQEDFCLDLYAGSPIGDTEWLKGFGGTYPGGSGGLTGFQASNSDGNATAGLKLVMGRFTTTVADDETLVVGGIASTIQAIVIGNTSVAAAGVDLKEDIGTSSATNSDGNSVGAAKFTVVGSPGDGVTAMMIVA